MKRTPLIALLLLFFLVACSVDATNNGGCEADNECKGDRICVDGDCMNPSDISNIDAEVKGHGASQSGDTYDTGIEDILEDDTNNGGCKEDEECEGMGICVDGDCVDPSDINNMDAETEGRDASQSGETSDSGVEDYLELDWVSIRSGSFAMGCEYASEYSSTLPVHDVNIKGFEILKSEVTVQQYSACVDAGECSEPYGANDPVFNWGLDGPKDDRLSHPINGVSWESANVFCEWVLGRLPSEAEWEYAAGSEGRKFYVQDDTYPWGHPLRQKPSCDYVVMDDGGPGCGSGHTLEVCSRVAGNTFQDLCDMAGNLSEWVADNWHSNYTGAPDDGSSWIEDDYLNSSRVVIRGGSLFVKEEVMVDDDFSIFLSCGRSPSDKNEKGSIGFRCVR